MLLKSLRQCALSAGITLFASVSWADPYLYSSVCPKGPDGNPGGGIYGGKWVPYNPQHPENSAYWVDQWGFAQCNCTSYVANRINMTGIAFTNTYGDRRWSHGKDWYETARLLGITVDRVPAPGSVAQWNDTEIAGGLGHVAYVEHVVRNVDGSVKSIVVSQYNITAYSYSSETLEPGKRGYPPRFIHFDLRSRGIVGWFPPIDYCHRATQWFLIGTDPSGERYPIGSATRSACDLVPASCQN